MLGNLPLLIEHNVQLRYALLIGVPGRDELEPFAAHGLDEKPDSSVNLRHETSSDPTVAYRHFSVGVVGFVDDIAFAGLANLFANPKHVPLFPRRL